MRTYKGASLADLVLVLRLVDEKICRLSNSESLGAGTRQRLREVLEYVQPVLAGCGNIHKIRGELCRLTDESWARHVELTDEEACR